MKFSDCVGIFGFGGFGYMVIKFVKAFGREVIAILFSASKRVDVLLYGVLCFLVYIN